MAESHAGVIRRAIADLRFEVERAESASPDKQFVVLYPATARALADWLATWTDDEDYRVGPDSRSAAVKHIDDWVYALNIARSYLGEPNPG